MIIQAQSKEEAIEIVKRQEHICEEDIIDIITVISPNVKLFGMVKQLGSYEISINKPSENISDKTSSQQKEYIEVLQGSILVSNPEHHEALPILYVHDTNVDLYINDEKISTQAVVQEDDTIKIEFHHIDPSSNINILMSPDKMQVKMNIIKNPGKRYYLEDTPKSNRVNIKTRFEWVEPNDISLDQCLELLNKYNVKNDFIEINAIQELLDSNESHSNIVARGIPLVPSKNTEINYSYKFFQDPLTMGVEPIVEIGEVLAVKVSPAIPGKNGETVTGEILQAKEVVDINLCTGTGASLKDNDNKIVSDIVGRPYLKDGVITVVPLFLVNGDFTNQMGEVNFEGDIIVKGNVLDEVHLKATGNINIVGSVYNSSLYALKSISISGKVISSTIQAGADISKFYLIIPHLEAINGTILQIFDEMKGIQKGLGHNKLNIIYQHKEAIEVLLKKIYKVTDLMDREDASFILTLIKDLKNSLLMVSMLKEEGFKMLLTFYNEVIQFISEIENLVDDNVKVTFSYAQNSQISSCGDITVTGKGSYQSNLTAQNKISYESSNSVVKGGTLIAEWEIAAGIVGTPNEIYTECRVSKSQGQVKGYFYPGVVVIVNNEKQDIKTIDNH
ncbi:MAG: flagellar assembly protein A [Eubacteriales bacterium]